MKVLAAVGALNVVVVIICAESLTPQAGAPATRRAAASPVGGRGGGGQFPDYSTERPPGRLHARAAAQAQAEAGRGMPSGKQDVALPPAFWGPSGLGAKPWPQTPPSPPCPLPGQLEAMAGRPPPRGPVRLATDVKPLT